MISSFSGVPFARGILGKLYHRDLKGLSPIAKPAAALHIRWRGGQFEAGITMKAAGDPRDTGRTGVRSHDRSKRTG